MIVQPQDNVAYTIFAQPEDRSGYARGTLAPKMGMTAAVPPMDPRPMRTMVDMGMGKMAGMKMGDMADMDMSGVDGMKEKHMPASSENDAAAKDMSGSAEKDKQGMAGMNRDNQSMAGMDMGSDSAEHMQNEDQNQQTMTGMEMGSSTGTTPFPQPGPNTMPTMPVSRTANTEANLKPSNLVRMHVGPQVVSVPTQVGERLNDPGDGLSGNGRRVLTYADLRARYRGVDGRPPTREIELHLSGNMERYIWGFNGQKFSSAGSEILKRRAA